MWFREIFFCKQAAQIFVKFGCFEKFFNVIYKNLDTEFLRIFKTIIAMRDLQFYLYAYHTTYVY